MSELVTGKGLFARVFDAGALPSESQFNKLNGSCVLTPHIGEFERPFGRIFSSLEDAARSVAKERDATMALKSAQTAVASPEGEICINKHTSPYLAKAGTGDVLAGIITSPLAQAIPPFEA